MDSEIDISKYDASYVGALLGMALIQLYKHDQYLIENDVHERTITHRIAVYFEHLFPEFNVDCEYNKHLKNTKAIFLSCEDTACPSECRNKCSKYNKIIQKPEKIESNDDFPSLVCPDIIIHQRNEEKNNLLVVEAKKEENNDGEQFDKCKLEKYRKQLEYRYSAFILFKKNSNIYFPEIEFYQKGYSIPYVFSYLCPLIFLAQFTVPDRNISRKTAVRKRC